MEFTEEGKFFDPDWLLEIRCSGIGWEQKNKPCYGKAKIRSNQIVKRYSGSYDGDTNVNYGFICSRCHCFTVINEKEIPEELKQFCLTVAAKGSDGYSDLNKEEKELSKVL